MKKSENTSTGNRIFVLVTNLT